MHSHVLSRVHCATTRAAVGLNQIAPVLHVHSGDCAIHSGMLVHGAAANMTNTRRLAMVCAYMPDGSTFNGVKNVLPDSYIASIEVGDVLDDDFLNPLIWHRDPTRRLAQDILPTAVAPTTLEELERHAEQQEQERSPAPRL